MKYKISIKELDMLTSLKMKALLIQNRFSMIQDFTVEKITKNPKKTWFNRNPKEEIEIYLTGITIWGYNEDGKFLGTLKEEYCYHLIKYFDFYSFRKKWEVLNEALNALGYSIVRTDSLEPKSDKNETQDQKSS